MICVRPQTFAFYGLVTLFEIGIAGFIGHFWYKVSRKPVLLGWRWSSVDSRSMWMDAAKTMITASGIAVALVASLTLRSQKETFDPLLIFSIKIATVSLVTCLCASMVYILALSRGHEAAKARNTERLRLKGDDREVKDGPLSDFALYIILGSGFVALSGFFIGFLFLGRIVWDF